MPSPNFTNNMVKGIIYKYTAPDGAVYIGQTTNIKRRLASWLDKDGYAKGLISKHRCLFAPEQWSYEVVELISGGNKEQMLEKLNNREIFWIGYYTALVDNNLCPMLLNDDIGGGNKGGDYMTDMIEDYVNNVVLSTKGYDDDKIGYIDCFNEDGERVATAKLSQLVRKNRSKKAILQSLDDHSWIGFRTYRRKGECESVDPCPNRPVKKEKETKEPKYCIYNVFTMTREARVNTISEAAAIMGNDTCKIASVLKGGKEQYNGFIIRRGEQPPTLREVVAALAKAQMPR